MTKLIRAEITCQDAAEAGRIGDALLSAHLAACVQSLPVTSQYHWQGRIETAGEILLIVKTRAALFEALCGLVKSLHSYDVPQITAYELAYVNADYADWVTAQTQSAK